MSRHAEIIVIGAGTMGTAAAWAAARRGHSVIAIEQFPWFHTMGSHGGHTRIFRHAYFEGEKYVPWSLESDRMFAELAERTGIKLQIRNGCLDIGTPENRHARLAEEAAVTHNLPYEMLTSAEVNERFPAWNLPEGYEACFDPHAGTLLVEPVFRALRFEAEAAGAELVESTPVTGWTADGTKVSVSTEHGDFTGDRLIVTAGPWASKVLHELNLPLQVTRKPVMWFEVENPEMFAPEQFPGFIIDRDVEEFYGLAAVSPDSLKMGTHSDRNVVDPDNFQRDVQPEDITAEFSEFVTNLLNGVRLNTTNTSMCMYTMTPDEDFIIDRHPHHANVSIAAGFSGHGFKFAPMIGEHLIDLVTKEDAETVEMFRISRFAT